MRVLQVNKFFYAKGGTERYFFDVSQALLDRGHHVSYFSMQHPQNDESSDAEFFVRERRYDEGYVPSLRDGVDFIRSGEAARQMQRLIDRNRPDVAHLHNIYHQLTPSIIPVLQRAGVPIVMTLHDYKLVCPNYALFDGKQFCERCRGGQFYRAPFARCNGGSVLRSGLLAVEAYWQKVTGVYDAVSYFLAPSRFMRDRIVGEGFGEERVVYLPAFLDAPPTNGDDPGGERYALYFGRLSPEKGTLTLLDAFERMPEIPLVIAGAGPLEHELRDQCHARGLDHIRFTGHLTPDRLQPLVAGASLVVLPSESPENAPFTVLEAMAAGVPVVVSDMGGLPELAELSGGRVFAKGDAAALAEQVEGLWHDEVLLKALSDRGRRAIAERFTVDRHMSELVAIYQRAIDTVQ